MILEIIVGIIIGFILGIIAGLIPGLHINLISSLIIVSLPFLLHYFSPFAVILFIVSMSITTVFLDFIPSTFLGAPEEDTALSILPSHELLMKGKANTAIFVSSLGSLIGIFASFAIIPLFFLFLESTYPFFEKMMFFLLVWIAIFLLMNNKNLKIVLIICILASFLGIAALNQSTNQPLLPLLTGLFGTSGIIFSINQKTKIPEQEKTVEIPKIKEITKPTLIGMCISPFCSFLPGLGSSQATIIGSKIFGNVERKQFLLMNGIINMIVSILSLVTLILIGKSRTGSAAAISQIREITTNELVIILFVIAIVGILSFTTTNFLSKKISSKINKLNYQKISYILLIGLTISTLLISGPRGMLVLTTSTCLGLACQYYGTQKNILMFCLLTPTILYYWPF